MTRVAAPAEPTGKPQHTGQPPGKQKPVRNPVFKFLSSVRLAVLLLLVLIVGCAVGTFYEQGFDARVARAYVYEAAWFNVWLLFLAVNLACAAFSRWPWKKHHTGFLVTHLGIIILLAGSMIGKMTGVEGTMTLFKGEKPQNWLVTDQQVLLVQDGNNARVEFPINIITRKPAPQKPWGLGKLDTGWELALTDYAPALNALFKPMATPKGGAPAVRLLLESPRLGQKIERWLLAGDPQHSLMDLGMAKVELHAGEPPTQVKPDATTPTAASRGLESEEAILVFANKPGTQVSHPLAGDASGANLTLEADNAKKILRVELRGARWSFDLSQFLGKEVELSGVGLRMLIESYWPDFELAGGKPRSASEEPKNPAVLVRIKGTASSTAPAGSETGPESNLLLSIYAGADSKLRYVLKGGKPNPVTGELIPQQPVQTGWADWQATVLELLPAALEYTEFTPLPEGSVSDSRRAISGVRVRAAKGTESHEEWVPFNWNVSLPTSDSIIQVVFRPRTIPLPIRLTLEKFTVERNEGSDSPASFKSDLLVEGLDGSSARGSCWMNHPFSFPTGWWGAWTGLTYKISQASWNPNNLDQTTVQILRDPGWGLKWIGCLLICLGIYTLFYLRPYPQFQKRKAPAK